MILCTVIIIARWKNVAWISTNSKRHDVTLRPCCASPSRASNYRPTLHTRVPVTWRSVKIDVLKSNLMKSAASNTAFIRVLCECVSSSTDLRCCYTDVWHLVALKASHSARAGWHTRVVTSCCVPTCDTMAVLMASRFAWGWKAYIRLTSSTYHFANILIILFALTTDVQPGGS